MKEPISYKYLKISMLTSLILSFMLTLLNIYLIWDKSFITTILLISILLPLLMQLIILNYINKVNDIRIFINVFALIVVLGGYLEYSTLYKENLNSNLLLYNKTHLIVKIIYVTLITYFINTKEVKKWVAENKIDYKKSNKKLFIIIILYLILANTLKWIYTEQYKAKFKITQSINKN